MSDSDLDMQDLFAAARKDAPSSETRDAVWGRVVVATSLPAIAGAAGAAGAGAAPVAKAAAGTKLLAIGAAIGATTAAVAAIVVASLLPSQNAWQASSRARREPAGISSSERGARHADDAPRKRWEPVPVPLSELGAPSVTPEPAAAAVDHDGSSLSEEARLVTEARRALMRGDAERALALVRRAHGLPARALEPEELGLEMRALEKLGRTDEALATELTLKRRYPSHALAR